MISIVKSDLASWVHSLIEFPDSVLLARGRNIRKDLFTSKELLLLYDPERRTKYTANSISKELSRAKIKQIYDGRPIKLKNGIQRRYYAIRNIEKWENSPLKNIVSYLDEH